MPHDQDSDGTDSKHEIEIAMELEVQNVHVI